MEGLGTLTCVASSFLLSIVCNSTLIVYDLGRNKSIYAREKRGGASTYVSMGKSLFLLGKGFLGKAS